jgi:adenosylhomocysteine nucleosidase
MIAVLAALAEEAEALRRHLRRPEAVKGLGPRAWRGSLADRPVLLFVTGDGPARAMAGVRRLLATETPDRVVIIGVCGALVPGLGVGTVVCPDRVCRGDTTWREPLPSWSRTVRTRPGVRGGTLISVDQVITDPEHRSRIAAGDEEPIAVDLESATWVEALALAGIPWVVLRGVSDTATERLPPWLHQTVRADGSVSRLRVAARALTDPAAVPALWRLAARTRRVGRDLVPLVEMLVAAASPMPGQPSPNYS